MTLRAAQTCGCAAQSTVFTIPGNSTPSVAQNESSDAHVPPQPSGSKRMNAGVCDAMIFSMPAASSGSA